MTSPTGDAVPSLQQPSEKTRITIRLDDDVLEWFRRQVDDAGGGSYQTMINQVSRSHIEIKQEPLDAIVRRVVKDELRKSKPRKPAKSRKAVYSALQPTKASLTLDPPRLNARTLL